MELSISGSLDSNSHCHQISSTRSRNGWSGKPGPHDNPVELDQEISQLFEIVWFACGWRLRAKTRRDRTRLGHGVAVNADCGVEVDDWRGKIPGEKKFFLHWLGRNLALQVSLDRL